MSFLSLFANEFGEVTQYQKTNDVDILEVKHSLCTASISLYGGQVLTWQLKNQPPVFWISDASSYQAGKAIRGGIPLCWPWFGAYFGSNKNGGNHGFARLMQWQLVDIHITEQAVVITLSVEGENVSSLWPTPFRLIQKLIFSTQFTQQLTIENLSEQPVRFTSALHSYFQVSSPRNVIISDLNNVMFDDKITLLNQQQDSLVNCVGPLDRIYHANSIQQIKDSGWQRIIEVESSQCQQWVLWNPGKEIAQDMADIHANGESEYICLEAANTEWQTVAADQSVTLEQKVSVLPMNITPL